MRRNAATFSRPHAGLFVAVLGTDGTGKSALIAALSEHLGPRFAAVQPFHLRPRLVRPQHTAGPWQPHARPPYGPVMSLVKLAAMLADYAGGYRLRLRPLLRRSTLVLFDRYYDDILVDPLRFRYRAPLWPARLAARAVPRPDLFLVLDCDEQSLMERKPELPPAELRRQIAGYRRLAARLPNAVLLDTRRGLPEVTAQAAACILAAAAPPI